MVRETAKFLQQFESEWQGGNVSRCRRPKLPLVL